MHHALSDILIVLLVAIAVTALFQRLRISPILGYLFAGIMIGPSGFGLFAQSADTRFLAELGVVFLLFAIGLEMPIARLKAMRREMFGLGLAQVALTATVIASIAWAMGQPMTAALILGGALALSSTATVLRLLVERRELGVNFGRTSLSILLFQDIAVMPMLALVPLLGREGGSFFEALLTAFAAGGVALALIILVGRYLSEPSLAFVSRMRNSELFTALVLLILLGAAWISEQAGLSMALGAFVAGILLAGTPYKHQVEADILPFRGLLLGLFFLTVGMQMDAGLIAQNWASVAALTLGLIVLKAAIIVGLALAFGHTLPIATRTAFMLAQGGEFAFVLLGLAAQQGQIEVGPAWQYTNAAVGLSIMATPLLFYVGRMAAQSLEARSRNHLKPEASEFSEIEDHVIVAGYGRVGRAICHLLDEFQIPYVALDMDSAMVARAREKKLPIYFGDASRSDVLRSVGAERARLAVVTLDDHQAAEHTVAALYELRDDLPIMARARDANHARVLEKLGAVETLDEAKETSLILAERALALAGLSPAIASERASLYRENNYARLDEAMRDLLKM